MSSALARDRLIPFALAFGLALLYAFSAPRSVALEDDGLFLLAGHFAGVAHPPGYPLWVLIAHVASLIPLGPEAWRLHFLSGIIGALACVALWHAALRLGMSRLAATLAAATYGVSRVFWSQSIIAEVYTLNALAVFTLLALILRWRERPDARGAALIGLVYGLGLANHWPLLILETPALALFLLPAWRDALRQLPLALTGVLVGLAPYAWMVWRSQQDPVISFYGPIDSWEALWYLVSRAGYSGVDLSATGGWSARLQFLGFVARELAVQFGPAGTLLLALGLGLRATQGWRTRNTDDAAILLGVLGPTVLLIALLGFDYDRFHQSAFRVYPLGAYGFAALWLGFGVQWLLKQDALRRRAAVGVLAALLLGGPLALGAQQNLRGDYEFGDRYARALLSVPEPGAVLFVRGDTITGPAAWTHLGLGVRQDLELYETLGVLMNNRLFRPDRAAVEDRHDRLLEFIDATPRPVYSATTAPSRYASELMGLAWRLDRSHAAGLERAGYSPRSFEFYDWLVALPPPADDATNYARRMLLADMSAYLLRLPEDGLVPKFRAWRERALAVSRQSLQGSLVEADILLARDGAAAAPEVLRLLDHASSVQLGQAETRREAVSPDILRGDAYHALGNEMSARAAWQHAWDAWPNIKNPAAARLTGQK